jgi:hypothetical protein
MGCLHGVKTDLENWVRERDPGRLTLWTQKIDASGFAVVPSPLAGAVAI